MMITALNQRGEISDGDDRALAIRADRAVAYANRGNVLMSLGRLEEALAALDAAAAIQPDNFIVHINRGNALKELGRLK